ncbi:hypothetical protein HYC85_002471 [Camellia sinensis]|uniref:Uncharacterized protein n=1 Tax=Camellia sinensis TaxID=4442 RepID=A0A7J7I8F4_CAMSI|nr:hypothetical protein HYC85_002471 [Camellia sinensis]
MIYCLSRLNSTERADSISHKLTRTVSFCFRFLFRGFPLQPNRMLNAIKHVELAKRIRIGSHTPSGSLMAAQSLSNAATTETSASANFKSEMSPQTLYSSISQQIAVA